VARTGLRRWLRASQITSRRATRSRVWANSG
jgi:hypothetical protein